MIDLDLVYRLRIIDTGDLYWTVLIVRTAPYQRLTQPADSVARGSAIVRNPRAKRRRSPETLSMPPPRRQSSAHRSDYRW